MNCHKKWWNYRVHRLVIVIFREKHFCVFPKWIGTAMDIVSLWNTVHQLMWHPVSRNEKYIENIFLEKLRWWDDAPCSGTSQPHQIWYHGFTETRISDLLILPCVVPPRTSHSYWAGPKWKLTDSGFGKPVVSNLVRLRCATLYTVSVYSDWISLPSQERVRRACNKITRDSGAWGDELRDFWFLSTNPVLVISK